MPCTWTPSGVHLVLVPGLTIAADDLALDRYGQKALVTVQWRGQVCHRQRLNLDDPRQRKTFVERLVLAGQQAGMTLQTQPLRRMANRVTPAVLMRVGEACRQRPPTPPRSPAEEQAERARTIAAAEHAAGALLNDPAILDRVCDAMWANGYAGDLAPAVLAYVALTSRFTDRPINLALVADAAAGKNTTLDAALALVPEEEVYEFSAGSPRALLYLKDLRHRVVVFKEADSIPNGGAAASGVRALAEDNRLQYALTTLNRKTGRFETETITKSGPTGLLTTSTRGLPHQLNTRLLPVPIAADPDTTRAVIRAKAQQAAGAAPPRQDREPFLALQRWLALAGCHPVIVPFAKALADLMPKPLNVRLRRDFVQLLSGVKTLALLHQRQRQQAPGGEILATIEDYAVVEELFAPSFAAIAEDLCPPMIWDMVDAIGSSERDISETQLAHRLRLTKQAISPRVRRALKEGWLVNDEPRRGLPYRLRRGGLMPGDVLPLPEADAVAYAVSGVPAAVRNAPYLTFAADLAAQRPEGVTVAEWAGQGERDVGVVRQRLDALVAAGLLVHDPASTRYGVLFWA